MHIFAGRRGAALRGSTVRRAPRPREQPSLDAAHPPRRWGPRPALAPRPPRSPMWMMESARTDTHWHIQGRSHSVSASMSPGRAAHPPGPGARPRAARSGEAPVRVQSRAAPRESEARPCVFPRAPAPAPCARPSPAQPSAVGLPLRWWLRRRWRPEPRPARRGRPAAAAAAAALPAALEASEAAEAVAAAAGSARRLRASCVSEPRRGAELRRTPPPLLLPLDSAPLPSLLASSPPPSSRPRDCGASASQRGALPLAARRGRRVLSASSPRDARRPAERWGPAGAAAGRDLAALGLVPPVRQGPEDGEGSACDCPRGFPEPPGPRQPQPPCVSGHDPRPGQRAPLGAGPGVAGRETGRGTEPGTETQGEPKGTRRGQTSRSRAAAAGSNPNWPHRHWRPPIPHPAASGSAGSRAGGSHSEAQFMAGNRRIRDRGAWT